jgi:hypothetical protein
VAIGQSGFGLLTGVGPNGFGPSGITPTGASWGTNFVCSKTKLNLLLFMEA